MYDELVNRLHRYSENCVAYKLDADFASAVHEAAEAIEELSVVVRTQKAVLDKFPRWIPVSERLPEKEGSVLIFSELGGIAEGHYSHMYGVWVQYRWNVKGIKVSHWMPLPEPPKEE